MKKTIALVMMVAMLMCGFGNAFAGTLFDSLLEECFTSTGKSSFFEYALDLELVPNTCMCLCDDDGSLIMEYRDDDGDHYLYHESDYEIDTLLEILKIFRDHADAIFFTYVGEEYTPLAYSLYMEKKDGVYNDWAEFTAAILAAM